MSNRTEELAAEIVALSEQITQLDAKRQALREEFASLKCPFKPDDIIKFRRGVSMAEGVVQSVRPAFMDRYDIIVRRILKDGSLGQVITVYSYDKPEKVEA